MIKPWLSLPHGIGFNSEGNILGLCQAVIALRKLGSQHLAVLVSNTVKVIIPVGNTDLFLKAFRIRCHVHEGQFKVNRAVKRVQEGTPLFEDCGLVLLLCQLVVDILILNGQGIVAIRYPTDSVRKHALKRNRILGAAGDSVIASRFPDNLQNLFFLRLTQVLR